MSELQKPFVLPCGAQLKNRLAKAAMTERIANSRQEPTEAHNRLYSRWSETGSGLLISGNVLIDRDHLESAGNVCFDEKSDLEKLKSWASSVGDSGTHFWIQLSHAGRQTNRFVNGQPLAPSAVHLKKMGLFGKPVAMNEADIHRVIEQFRISASITREAGFTGVQIHAAHGYLLSQFLAPNTNRRTDKWGGSLENRMRLLKEVLRVVRNEVGTDFPISVKLNSADFQKGGFKEDEALEVVKMLDQEGVDLLEISGGTYEKLAFFLEDENQRESTKKREAYFLDFAEKVRESSDIPIMVTGGFRTSAFCNEAIKDNKLDLVGMGRPFLSNITKIPDFIATENTRLSNPAIRSIFSSLDDSAEGGFYARQLIQLAKGKPMKRSMNPLACAVFLVTHEFFKGLRRKKA